MVFIVREDLLDARVHSCHRQAGAGSDFHGELHQVQLIVEIAPGLPMSGCWGTGGGKKNARRNACRGLEFKCFYVFFVFSGTKIDGKWSRNGSRGPFGGQRAPGTKKGAKNGLDLVWI